VKRSIGIDFSENKICMVQLYHDRGKYILERSHVERMPKDIFTKETFSKENQATINNIINKGDLDAQAPVIINMPYNKVFFGRIITDLSSYKDVRQLLKFELEDDFPIPFDDLVADICSYRELNEQKREFLVGATSRSELQDRFQIMHEAGAECSMITTDICALFKIVEFNNEQIYNEPSLIIHMDVCRTILAISKKNRLLCVRYLNRFDATQNFVPILRQEIELTLRSISNSDIPVPSRILLSGTRELVHNFSEEFAKENNSEIVILDPFAQIKCSPEQQKDREIIIALGLALIGINVKNKELNFLAADKAKANQTARTKQNAIAFISLLIVLVATFLFNLFSQLKALENENQQIERKMREVFIQTIPEEKRIVNELAQITEKFKALEDEYNIIANEVYSRAPALRILQCISETITPNQNISVSSISINTKSTQLNGVAPSFESLDNMVGILSKISEFDSVNIKNADIDTTNNRVRFSLLIKISENLN